MNDKIGLVTVLYHSEEVLDDFFSSIAVQKYKNLIVYIIDNSNDNKSFIKSKRLKKKYSINAKFLKNQKNLGVAKGNNQGIEFALKDQCKFIVLLNNDIKFGPNTISQSIRFVKSKNLNILVPRINYFNTNSPWYVGGGFSRIKGAYHFVFDKKDHNKDEELRIVDYAPTCFIVFNSSLFDNVGYFDEDYFVYCDDSDFMYRLKSKKVPVHYTSKIMIEHKVSHSTGGADSKFTNYWVNRNLLILAYKNHKYFSIIPFLFNYLIRLAYKIIVYKNKKSLVQGFVDGLHYIFKNYKKRSRG